MKQILPTILISILGFLLAGGCSTTVENEGKRPEVQWNGKTVNSEEIVSDTIVTCSGDIIIGNGGSLTLDNGANGIRVRNCTGLSITDCIISNNGKLTERHDGCGLIVLVVRGSIDNCTIESNRFTGFEGSGDMYINISNCNIKNNSDFGIFIHDEFSSSLVDIASNTVENNANVSQMHAGISVEGEVKADVHDNILAKNYTGIRVLNNTLTSNFKNNTILNCSTWGIHMDNSSPIFYHNRVSGCNWVAFVQEENGTPHPNFGDTTVESSGYNDFSNNNNGIRNDSTVELKAENNYWGTTDGNSINEYNFTDDTPK